MKPGCYGSVLANNPNDAICKGCVFKDECGELAYQNLLSMRERLNVEHYVKEREAQRARAGQKIESGHAPAASAPLKAPARAREEVKLTKEQMILLTNKEHPKKARELLLGLFKRGICAEVMRGALKQGHNPFRNETPEIMRVACALLLNGGFDRKSLIRAIMVRGESRKGYDTARSQASTVMAALVMTGVARLDGDRYTMEVN